MSGALSKDNFIQTSGPSSPVVVIGCGISGALAAKALRDLGLTVTYVRIPDDHNNVFGHLSEPDEQGLTEYVGIAGDHSDTFVTDTLPSVRREGPFFRIDRDGLDDRLFGCVVIASGVSLRVATSRQSNEDILRPGETVATPQRLCFILDAGHQSDMYAGVSALDLALKNQTAGGTSSVFFQNIPVAHPGAEELYDQAKKAGVVFVRYDNGMPPVVDRFEGPHKSSGFRVQVTDLVAGGDPVETECDRVFLVGFPDACSLDNGLRGLVAHDVDAEGFLLSESIHSASGRSFINGVFAVGECTGLLGLTQIVAQAYSVSVKARSWLRQIEDTAATEKISVADECIRCLTCYRVCPHAAISVNYAASRSKIRALANSCQQCGICVSECPRMALDLTFFPEIGISGFVDEIAKIEGQDSFVVYGCERSTADLMAKIEAPSEALYFSVPCAGRISENMLWATLSTGVSGILVVGCHPGNCASKYGTEWAGKRVNQILGKMQSVGIPSPQIAYTSVSSRETARLEGILRDFKASLKGNHDVFSKRNEIRK